MGPTCEVLLEADDGGVLNAIEAVLAATAQRIERSRKGRVWDVWVGGRPVHVSIDGSPPIVTLAAGCNGSEDYGLLRQLAQALASALGGVASEPVK